MEAAEDKELEALNSIQTHTCITHVSHMYVHSQRYTLCTITCRNACQSCHYAGPSALAPSSSVPHLTRGFRWDLPDRALCTFFFAPLTEGAWRGEGRGGEGGDRRGGEGRGVGREWDESEGEGRGRRGEGRGRRGDRRGGEGRGVG